MDTMSIKAKDVAARAAATGGDSAKAGTGGLKGLGVSFTDLLNLRGARVEGGLNGLVDKSSLTSTAEKTAQPEAPRERADAPRDDRDDGAPVKDAARHDDYAEQGADHRDDVADTHDAPDAAAHDGRRDDNRSDDTDTHHDAASDDAAPAKAEDDGTGESTADNGENGAEKAANAETGSDNGQADTHDGQTAQGNGTQNNEQVLSDLVAQAAAGAAGKADKANANANAQAGTQAAAGRDNAADGLDAALANATRDGKGEKGKAQNNAANAANANAKAANANAGQAAANPATQANAAAQGQQAATNAQRQAADLSAKVGNGNKIDVTVTVTDEADTLVSRPTGALSATAAAGREAASAKQGNQQAMPGQNQPGLNVNAAQASVQNAAQAAQQNQAAQGGTAQAAQVHAAQGNAGQTAGPAPQAASAATAAQGGGEAMGTGANQNAQNAQNSQQANQARQAQHQPQAQARQAVADQVSVQISKAVQAGNDRISIQLKPADLGRIDVELKTADGKTTVTVMADNKDTLDLLKGDARALTKALQDAGLDTDAGNLNFGLRGGDQNTAAGDSQHQSAGGRSSVEDAAADVEEPTLDELLSGEWQPIIRSDRVDVRA